MPTRAPRAASVLAAAAALLLAGCFGGGGRDYVPRQPMVTVEWLGHSTFRLRDSSGMTVVTNPFDPEYLDYPAPVGLKADVVLITHESSEANHIDLLRNAPQIVRSRMGVGNTRASGMLVKGVAYSQATSYSSGVNVAYQWRMDGVAFTHLGAPRELVDKSALRELEQTDVLFLPLGGRKLFPESDFQTVLRRLRPSLIVPMSYRTGHSTRLVLPSLDAWLSGRQGVRRLGGQTFTVREIALPAAPLVLIPEIL